MALRYFTEKHIDGYTVVDGNTGQTITDGKPHMKGTTYLSKRDAEKRARALNEADALARKHRDAAPNTDGLGREELEREALWRVSATNYYDLADNISECTDQDLRDIIEANGNEEAEQRLHDQLTN